jgi:hypothetical protein
VQVGATVTAEEAEEAYPQAQGQVLLPAQQQAQPYKREFPVTRVAPSLAKYPAHMAR